MPTYTFRDKNSLETFEKFLSISAKEKFLAENPSLESLITTATPTLDSVRLGIRRIDNGFKEVLQKIDSRSPGSQVRSNSRYI